VAAVDRGDVRQAQPLGGRYDRGVDGAQRKVAIGRNEFGDP
jgi:hypothetical protein